MDNYFLAINVIEDKDKQEEEENVVIEYSYDSNSLFSLIDYTNPDK